jgi:vacuolar-type H+-ATPase subunit H
MLFGKKLEAGSKSRLYHWIKEKNAKMSSELLTGRTKETHEYLAVAAKKISEKMKKISDEQRKELIDLKERGVRHQKIVDYFIEKYQIILKISSISTIYNRERKQGKTNPNFDILKVRSKRQSILSKEQSEIILLMKNSGKTNSEIYKFLHEELKISLAASSISGMLIRAKLSTQ